VRYLGASSMAAWQFSKALYAAKEHGWHRFAAMQNHYNLVYREEEREMNPLCVDQGVALIPWSPLARGFFARNHAVRSDAQTTKRAETDEFAQKFYFQESDFAVAAAVDNVAKQRGVSPTQVACAWILQAPGVTAPIIGATKVAHLKELVAAVEIKLTAEEVAAVEAPYQPHPVIGHEQPSAKKMGK
jgi:1-deoxyxylulose-5-phosphate synthase